MIKMCIEIGNDEPLNGFNSTDMIEFASMIVQSIDLGTIGIETVNYEALLHNYCKGKKYEK